MISCRIMPGYSAPIATVIRRSWQKSQRLMQTASFEAGALGNFESFPDFIGRSGSSLLIQGAGESVEKLKVVLSKGPIRQPEVVFETDPDTATPVGGMQKHFLLRFSETTR